MGYLVDPDPNVRLPFPYNPEGDALGTDLLHEDELPLDGAGDYIEVSGEDNLRLSLRRRMIVRPGEYKFRPNFGVGILDFLKKPLTSSRLDEIRTRIVNSFGSERRLESVSSIALDPYIATSGLQGLIVNPVVVIRGRKLQFQPFDFVSKG